MLHTRALITGMESLEVQDIRGTSTYITIIEPTLRKNWVNLTQVFVPKNTTLMNQIDSLIKSSESN